jgi:hypothetical protein
MGHFVVERLTREKAETRPQGPSQGVTDASSAPLPVVRFRPPPAHWPQASGSVARVPYQPLSACPSPDSPGEVCRRRAALPGALPFATARLKLPGPTSMAAPVSPRNESNRG